MFAIKTGREGGFPYRLNILREFYLLLDITNAINPACNLNLVEWVLASLLCNSSLFESGQSVTKNKLETQCVCGGGGRGERNIDM